MSVRIVHEYIDESLDKEHPRPMLQAAERIARFAARDSSCFAYKAFGIDVLDCIPKSLDDVEGFGDVRHHQIVEHIAERREKFSKMWERMEKLSDPRKGRFRL